MAQLNLATLVSHPIQYEVPVYRQLSERDDVDLTVYYCSDKALDRWDLPMLTGYEYEFLDGRWSAADLRPPLKNVNPSVVDHLTNRDHDALLVDGWISVTNWLAFLTAAAVDLPVIVRGDSNPRGEQTAGPLSSRGRSVLLSAFFKYVDAFGVVGTQNERFYRDHGVTAEKLFDAPLVVDNQWFREREAELPEPAELRRELGVPEDGPIVLFLGRLVERKRPEALLEAFARATEPDEATLLFVGIGPLRERLEQLARRRGRREDVRLTGFVEQSDLPKYYKLADVFALPSADEPWGLVVNEAMNFGLPVVTTDVVGAGEDLVDDENGFVVPPDDTGALTGALQRLLSDRALRERLGTTSRDRIEQWTPDRTASGLIEAARYVR